MPCLRIAIRTRSQKHGCKFALIFDIKAQEYALTRSLRMQELDFYVISNSLLIIFQIIGRSYYLKASNHYELRLDYFIQNYQGSKVISTIFDHLKF